MPTGRNRLHYGGIDLEDGSYAVVQVGQYDPIGDGDNLNSDLFTPLTLEVAQLDAQGKEVTERRFYLAPVSAFVDPCIVVPDMGGPPNAFFQVKNRSQWSNEFVHWLKEKHTDDQMTDSATDSQRSPLKKKARTN